MVSNARSRPPPQLHIGRRYRWFTRAGERVHRTQSTVSQQIRRLEESLGYPLLHRNGSRLPRLNRAKGFCPMRGEFWRLKQEAREVVARPEGEGVVRIGVTEDSRVPADRVAIGLRPLTSWSAA